MFPERIPFDLVRRMPWVISVLIFSLLVFGTAGCTKQAAGKPQTLEEAIVQLRAALVKASPDVQRGFYNGVDYGIHYGNYADALMALDRIRNDPSLNDQQKKLIEQVSGLLLAKIQNPQNAAKPAQ